MGDLRPTMSPALAAFGLPATVTRPSPDDTPIATTGIWLSDLVEDREAFTADFMRRDARRVMALPRADVPAAPTGTRIRAAEMDGQDERDWVVDGYAHNVDPDHLRVILVLAT